MTNAAKTHSRSLNNNTGSNARLCAHQHSSACHFVLCGRRQVAQAALGFSTACTTSSRSSGSNSGQVENAFVCARTGGICAYAFQCHVCKNGPTMRNGSSRTNTAVTSPSRPTKQGKDKHSKHHIVTLKPTQAGALTLRVRCSLGALCCQIQIVSALA